MHYLNWRGRVQNLIGKRNMDQHHDHIYSKYNLCQYHVYQYPFPGTNSNLTEFIEVLLTISIDHFESETVNFMPNNSTSRYRFEYSIRSQ